MMDETKEIAAGDETMDEADAAFLAGIASVEDDEAAEMPEEDSVSEMPEESDTAETVEGYICRIAELEERLSLAEAERAERERELMCLSLLERAGLPSGLSSAVMASDDMEQTVEQIGEAVKAAVEAEMLKRCRTDAPAAGTRAPLTKEELIRMPVAELQRMRDMGAVLG